MSVYEHDRARVFGSGAHFVTVLPVAMFCTCDGFSPSENPKNVCGHIADVTEKLEEESAHYQRLLVEHSIRVLPQAELRRAA